MSLVKEFMDLRPHGGFDLIMADPPWSFDNYSAAGEGKNAKAHYRCQPDDWIKHVPVSVLAADNCLLMLWATNPMLPQALEVMVAWGFQFKTQAAWVKRTRNLNEAFGTGYLLRSAHEPLLLGTRGAPKTTRATRSVIVTREGEAHYEPWPAPLVTIEAQTAAHSVKPDAAYEAAEALMPDGRRIELFSRRTRRGWAAWGDEVGKLDPVTESVDG
ncbi:MAG: MT-A70 family methyltransferase [Pseudomonadota bacterium]